MGPDPAPVYILPELISGGNAAKSISLRPNHLASHEGLYSVRRRAHPKTGVDVELSDGQSLRAVPGRVRRTVRRDLYDSWYRVPWVGSVDHCLVADVEAQEPERSPSSSL
jgi:hypothetical protein